MKLGARSKGMMSPVGSQSDSHSPTTRLTVQRSPQPGQSVRSPAVGRKQSEFRIVYFFFFLKLNLYSVAHTKGIQRRTRM
jgi:hypothetical protein